MPELPEVETVIRGLRPRLDGQRLVEVTVRRAVLRKPVPENFARRLEGRRVRFITRRAKYGLVHMAGGLVLLFHLGMSGRLRLVPADKAFTPERHDHIVFVTEQGDRLAFNDARRFGLVDLVDEDDVASHPLLAGLGPEPLGNAFDGAHLGARLKNRRTPIKAALLDQRVVAGLGNIYASEALACAGISPRRGAHRVAPARTARLAEAVRQVLTRAIEAGGSSLRDHIQPDGALGYFQHQFRVYGRAGAPCLTPACGGTIVRIVQAGRASFYCPACQR
ncbi:MAG: bifunctional DNA-formamidopyrimidine glycosylase/DNA-(apurinic or apyrimidinic site) lyase [Pseudomonadota bacterium]